MAADDLGRRVIEVLIPLRLKSESNVREHHMERAKRARAHRQATHWALRAEAIMKGTTGPLTITLTRYGPRLFDPGNHEGSFKHVQDGVADFLGRDDGDPALTWQYEQAIGKDYAVRVRIEA